MGIVSAKKYDIEVCHDASGKPTLMEVWFPEAKITIRATHGYIFKWHYESGEYPWCQEEEGDIIQRDASTLEMNPHCQYGVFIIKPILEELGYTVNMVDWHE